MSIFPDTQRCERREGAARERFVGRYVSMRAALVALGATPAGAQSMVDAAKRDGSNQVRIPSRGVAGDGVAWLVVRRMRGNHANVYAVTEGAE